MASPRESYVSMSAASAQRFNKKIQSGAARAVTDTVTGAVTLAPILLYPSDIGSNVHQASYILFTGYSITKAKLKPTKRATKTVAGRGRANVEVVDQVATDRAKKAALAKQNLSGSSLLLARKNYPQSDTVIGLYMPPSVNVSYSMDYESAPIGTVGEVVGGIIKDIASGAGYANTTTNAGDTASTGVLKKGIGMVDAVVPGAKDLLAIETGVIITPRTELMFRGIGRREFSFTFTFIPKDYPESKIVHAIVQKFKEGMSPSFNLSATTRELTIPDVFQIDYMHITGQNSYLNKIGRCYLQKMDVTYGGDKFVTYDDAGDGQGPPPQKTVIVLTFKELEIMDRAKVKEGF